MTRAPYLKDIPLDEAIRLFYEKLSAYDLMGILGVEEILLSDEVTGRVLAEAAFASRCSPHYHASAMDGFAIQAASTIGAQPNQPVILEAGSQAVYVDTGDPLPEGMDAVIPIENVESLDQNREVADIDSIRTPAFIRLRSAVTRWSNVRPVGEDLVEGQLILPEGEKLRPVDLGALAAGGISKLRVVKKPLVAILPTGDELVPLEKVPQRGELVEFNSIIIAGQIREWGGIPRRYPITRDDLQQLVGRIKAAANECDLVLVNAGSSAGKEDYTAQAVEELGEVIVHGIAVRPGHPVIIGFVNRKRGDENRKIPVIGVPGYPVSAALTTQILVKPLIDTWLGLSSPSDDWVQAQLTRKLTSPAGDDDYVRVVLGSVNGKLLAAPIGRGAGVTTSLSRADGITIIPRMVQGVEAGESVQVQLLRRKEQVNQNLLTIGSHDLTLDLMAQHLTRYNRRLVSSNAGSMGGLLALKRGECHFAGSHLLDPVSGTYNTADIQRMLPGRNMMVMRWVKREQGLIVPKSNPKKIMALEDLRRRDVTFVNRQRGAGTRVLLDFHLQKLQISPDEIQGYDQEEYSHIGVAVAVASGRADCGLGVAAAAKSLGLDFIAIDSEEYELIFPEGAELDPFVRPVFDLAHDGKFIDEIRKMPGYDVTFMGEIRSV